MSIAAPLGVWILNADHSFAGSAPPPALAAAISAFAKRITPGGLQRCEDVELSGGESGRACRVRLTAQALPGGGMAVASLALDGLAEAEDTLSRFDLVMTATHDAMWDWNVLNQRTWWNRQQYEMLGYDPESTAPSFDAWISRVHPEDRAALLRHFQEVMESSATFWQGEYRFVRVDDSVGTALDRGCIVRDASGKAVRVIGVMSDVTSERAATAALSKSEERFRQMTSAIDQVFWLTNPDKSEVAYVSPAYESIMGRTCESVYREPLSFLQAIHEDDRARVVARFPAQAEGKYDEVFRIRRPDGTIAWVRDRAFPIRDAAGKLLLVAGVATDITAQRHLEQQLAQAQRMESIGRLAGGIAHDFNNLLTVILSSVQMLRARVADAAGLGDLEAIQDAGDRAARLTSQLLTFARRQVVAPARIDVNDVARQMEGLLRRVIGEHIELKTALDGKLGAVSVDRAQLEQLLVNLAINARDAMPGGGWLTIETRNVSLGPETSASHAELVGDYVALVVSDSGIGIANDDLSHIFEPFFSTKPAGQGTGLGLATCHGIVHQAGGVILVDSALGSGTTFTILLPRLGDKAELGQPVSSPRIRQGTETILFVEDDASVRKVGVRILAEQNYSVLEAAGGAEALQLAASYQAPIHLLVTDVVMPRMNGTELAQRLLDLRPGLRVLYTSGYTESGEMHRGAFDPRFAFLQKPYVVETLLDKTRELLDGPC